MKKIAILGFAVLLVFTVSSCCMKEDVVLTSVDDVVLIGLSAADIVVSVENNSCNNIRIRSGSFTLSDGRYALLDASLRNDVRIPKRSSGTIIIPVALNIKSPLALMTLPRKLSGGNRNITVSGEAKVRTGIFCKRHKIEPTPLLDLIRMMGTDEKEVLDLLKI